MALEGRKGLYGQGVRGKRRLGDFEQDEFVSPYLNTRDMT